MQNLRKRTEEFTINNTRVTAIVPAAGRGTRLGSTVPKQFIELNGKPIFIYSLEVLDRIEEIRNIIIAAQTSGIHVIERFINLFNIKKVTDIVEGGKERVHSVRNAFERIKSSDYVLIHDSVRPFITEKIVKDVLATAITHNAAISAIPITDTVKFADDNETIVKNINRRGLWCAQTPQVFQYSMLAKAYEVYDKLAVEITDESALVELSGAKVKIVKGSIFNIKITTEEDLLLAKLIVNMP